MSETSGQDRALEELIQRINDEGLLRRPYPQRALIAAEVPSVRKGQRPRDFPDMPLTAVQIAHAFNVGISDLHRYRRVLGGCTPQEVELVRAGTISAQAVYDDLLLGLDADARQARREAPVDRPRRPPPGESKMHAEIHKTLKAALTALTALPLPADVAKIARSTPGRSGVVDRNLDRSLKWLTEFAHDYAARRDNAVNGEKNGQA